MPASFQCAGILVFLLSAVGTLRGAESLADGSDTDRLARGPYVQVATPRSMQILWRTWGPSLPAVRFGTNSEALAESAAGDAILIRAALGEEGQIIPPRWTSLQTPEYLRLRKLHSAPVGTFQYEARLTGLTPATRYYYAVFNGSRRLTPAHPSYSFVTPPPVGTRLPVRFSVLGDTGTGRLAQLEVYRAMLEQVERTGRPLDFWIHVGDMAYDVGRDMEFQSRVFEPYRTLLRNTVCWPTMGNHEGHTSKGTTGIGPYYDAYAVPTRGEAGGVASGTEAFYSFDHANLHFICLDSHDLDRRPSGAMARWLKADLEKANAEWLIAFWHHPPYTKGSHDSDKEKDLTEMRQYIMPIIESGGVDVVLTGHSHTYERSMLMDGAYVTPTVSENVILDDGDGDPGSDGPYRKSAGVHPHGGTVQVVAGHGGQTLGRTGSMPVMKRIFVEHGSVIIDVDGDTLTATMINRHGTVRDLFSIVKEGQIVNRRLALPWQPPAYAKPASEPAIPATPAVDHTILIAKNAQWRYQACQHPQGQTWTRLGFDPAPWRLGVPGFGFGDTSSGTAIDTIPNQAPAVYLRNEFHLAQADAVTELGLLVDYTHGFIAYINGHEVARVNIGRSSGRNVQDVKFRTGRGLVYQKLKDAHRYLRHGVNVLAIEAHGTGGALDFLIDPVLVLED